MKKIKLFLASSAELKADREQFEIFIYRKCKTWIDKGIFLHLDIWEDYFDAMSANGLQSEYNKAVAGSDIFVLLVHNKVGKYTSEEFEKAFGQFSETSKPFIFTYFKTPYTTQNREDLQSLWAFEDKLKELKHFKTEYHTIEGLREHFGNQLDKLAAADFIQFKSETTPDNSEKPVSQETKSNKIEAEGNGNIILQDVKGRDLIINQSSPKPGSAEPA